MIVGQDIKCRGWHLYCRLAMGQRSFTAGLTHDDSVSVNASRKGQVLWYSYCHVRKGKQTIWPEVWTSKGARCRKNLKVVDGMEQSLVKHVCKRKKLIHKEVPH